MNTHTMFNDHHQITHHYQPTYPQSTFQRGSYVNKFTSGSSWNLNQQMMYDCHMNLGYQSKSSLVCINSGVYPLGLSSNTFTPSPQLEFSDIDDYDCDYTTSYPKDLYTMYTYNDNDTTSNSSTSIHSYNSDHLFINSQDGNNILSSLNDNCMSTPSSAMDILELDDLLQYPEALLYNPLSKLALLSPSSSHINRQESSFSELLSNPTEFEASLFTDDSHDSILDSNLFDFIPTHLSSSESETSQTYGKDEHTDTNGKRKRTKMIRATRNEVTLKNKGSSTILSQNKRKTTKVTEDDTSFTCTLDNCGKIFRRAEHLKRHSRSIHTKEKPYKCQYESCGKCFSRSDNLSQHMRTHRPSSNELKCTLKRSIK